MNKTTDHKSVMNQLTDKDLKFTQKFEAELSLLDSAESFYLWLYSLSASGELKYCLSLVFGSVYKKYLELIIAGTDIENTQKSAKILLRYTGVVPTGNQIQESDKVDLR